MQSRKKSLQLKITKKMMDIANFINIYINMYTYNICDKNDSKKKNDSINSILFLLTTIAG